MTCLIFCDKKGNYCCDEGSDGKVAGFTVNNDPLILRAANLPPTPLLVQVNKEWIPTGDVIGGDVTCVVICKPGCYKLDLDCADFEGEAPSPGATELCYECDPAYGKLGALADAIAGGGGEAPPVVVDVSAIVDKLCEIFGVPDEGGPTILDKLCLIAELLDVDGPLYAKLCEMLGCLETIKKQDASFYEESIKFWTLALACFEKIKANTAAITGIETSLGQVGCVKDEDGNIIGSVLVCKVSDTTTSPPTDTIKVWLFGTDGSVVEDYDGPWEGCTSLTELRDLLQSMLECLETLKELDKATVMACCTGGATEATAVCFNVQVGLLTGNQENCTYKFNDVDLPTPYTQAQFMATMPAGSTVEIEGDTAKICTASTVTRCFFSICRNEGQVIGTLTRLCFVALPNTTEEECIDFLRTWGKYEEPIANTLEGIKSATEDLLVKQCDANEMASDALIKQCLLDDFWMNCVDVSEPIVPVPPINEEAVTTVTLAGDQTADYAVGSTVALYDAQGNIIGSGTVASAELDAEGNTVVTLSDAEMTGGATTAQIATVKPVLQQTVGAVKAVVKNVSILQAKRSLTRTATEGKKETAEKG